MLQAANLAQEVEVVSDGKAALDHLSDHESELDRLVAIFLNLNLPSSTGLHFLKQIRSDHHLTHLRVIAMTSANSPEDVDDCRKLGVSCYLQKPITKDSFSAAIAQTFHAAKDTGQLQRTFRERRDT